MQIGVSGHQDRSGIDWSWVPQSLRIQFKNLRGVTKALSSLAAGSDQVFARVAIDQQISVLAVLPVEGYEHYFHGVDLTNYRSLLAQSDVIQLNSKGDAGRAFFEAGKFIVDNTDILFAIWDGQAAEGFGGTADVVAYALKCSRKIVHINPIAKEVNAP